ncbi:hypothetical protein L596_024966 [Steinernema carpocapsae]|uniref:Little elongation complex subunit 2 C-terminal domain-containing protein n=1 Tax=Steinernema carpocapsae TaxID=34508 RepID=A0A4U5M6E5_STECR|nr:hypothetical protein L596_024966 [Steinernema carpocapsae]
MDEDINFCPLSLPKPTLEQLENHVWFNCGPCSRRKVEEKTGGKEMIFPRGTPEWAEPKKEVKKEEPDQKKPKFQKRERPQKKEEWQKETHEIIRDKMKNLGMTKREAQLDLVREKREAAQLKKSLESTEETQDKLKLQRSQMAWVPLNHFQVPGKQLSVFNHADHKRYVAIISNNANLVKKQRFQNNQIEIEEMDKALKPERDLFNQCVHDVFSKAKKSPYLHMDYEAKKLMKERCWERIAYLHEKYSKEAVGEVAWPHAVREAVMFYPKTIEVLEPGRLRQLKIPDVRRKATFKQLYADVEAMFPVQTEPKANRIENDPLIEEFVADKNVRIAADAGTLRRLFIGKALTFDEELLYPVTVKRVFTQGRLENVAVIGKPVCTNLCNNATLLRRYTKLLIKDNLGYLKDTLEDEPVKEEPVEEEPVEEPKEPVPEPSKPNPVSKNVPRSAFDDILDSMIEETSELPKRKPKEPKKQARTKKMYSIVSFREDQSSQIIVRSNNDGMEGDQSISWSHKMEYVPHIGAEQMRAEEWLWMFATNVFKPASQHLQMRVHYQEKDCLQIKRIGGPVECYHSGDVDMKCLIGERSTRIANLIDEIGRLHSGDYLLQEVDETMLILPQYHGDDDDPESVLLRETLQPTFGAIPNKIPPFHECFNGVDIHLNLVWHLVLGRIPGSLPPNDYFKNRRDNDGEKPQRQQWTGRRGRKRNFNDSQGSESSQGYTNSCAPGSSKQEPIDDDLFGPGDLMIDTGEDPSSSEPPVKKPNIQLNQKPKHPATTPTLQDAEEDEPEA